MQRDEFLRETVSRLRVGGCRRAILDSDVAAFYPSELLESVPECRDLGVPFWIGLGMRHQHTDARHTFALLRARCDRQRHRRTTEQRDELAPSDHSITSSARANSVAGTSSPSAFAVLRLTISSIFVDCWTGRSDGFSPLRMRPAYAPTRRFGSVRLTIP